MVERSAENLKVVGSIPILNRFSVCTVTCALVLVKYLLGCVLFYGCTIQ